MTDGITIRKDGRAEMAYVEGVKPWHDLGNELKAGEPIEKWIVAAGMDYRILRSKVRYNTTRGAENDGSQFRTFDNQHVFFRSDTGAPLGIGSEKFEIVQPKTTLEFFRDLTETVGFHLSTAGTLFGGRKYWALAETNAEAVIIDKRDRVKRNLLLATACDGSMATVGKYLATVVVCNNTLQIGLAEKGALQVKVTHRSKFEPVTVKRELGIEAAQSAFDNTIARMRRMAETRMSYETMILATCGLFHPDYGDMDRDRRDKVLRTKPVEPVAKMACDGSFIGSDHDGKKGTVYGWLNAVTQYVDHDAVTKGDFKQDNRIDSAWFGRGSAVKERAYEMAGAIVDSGGLTATQSVINWLAKYS